MGVPTNSSDDNSSVASNNSGSSSGDDNSSVASYDSCSSSMDEEEEAGIDPLLLQAKQAARKNKAKQVLAEWKQENLEAGKDTAWIDLKFADLDAFIKDNKEELDALLAEEKPNNPKKDKKRGLEKEEEDDKELLPDQDDDEGKPVKKKSAGVTNNGNFNFTF